MGGLKRNAQTTLTFRQVMEIKPQWLLEVAPHYFKPADLEQLAKGDKKMPKVAGSAGEDKR